MKDQRNSMEMDAYTNDMKVAKMKQFVGEMLDFQDKGMENFLRSLIFHVSSEVNEYYWWLNCVPTQMQNYMPETEPMIKSILNG